MLNFGRRVAEFCDKITCDFGKVTRARALAKVPLNI
jgi:hypothetical protein